MPVYVQEIVPTHLRGNHSMAVTHWQGSLTRYRPMTERDSTFDMLSEPEVTYITASGHTRPKTML